jgi:hypothetical protein
MTTNYANERITAAIKKQLLQADAIPPTAEAAKLAGDLTQVVLNEFNAAGLSGEAIEKLFAPSTLTANVHGVG